MQLAIGDGWYALYYKLCNEIQCIIDLYEYDPRDFYFRTVKEKFGLLRVYMSAHTYEIDKACHRAVEESGRTCERCGGVGKMSKQGWMSVMCDECRRLWEEEKAARLRRYTAQRHRRDSGYGAAP